MAKKNRRRKNPTQNQGSAYKKFIQEMDEVLIKTGIGSDLKDLPAEAKKLMYKYRIHLSNPVAISSILTPKEIKQITIKSKAYFKEETIPHKGKKISLYDLHLIYCYVRIKAKLGKRDKNEDDPSFPGFEDVVKSTLRNFASRYLIGFYRIIAQMGSPDKKYYGVIMRLDKIFEENRRMKYTPEIYAKLPNKQILDIDGLKRPAYQLSKISQENPIEWLSFPSSLFKKNGNCSKNNLDVFIQSHALRRMAERLDLLDKPALNYVLWENTNVPPDFIPYNGNYLLPVKLYEIKVGYLVAIVHEGRLLFKTFLFVTQTSTPEGDKLKKITGLAREDISYWKIDHMSSYINPDIIKDSTLVDLFNNAGIEDLFLLNDKDFDVEKIQSSNLEGLLQYISQGQNERITI